MNFIKRIAAKTGGFTIGITLSGVMAGISVVQKIFKKKGVLNENE